jgi:hypothetical protein
MGSFSMQDFKSESEKLKISMIEHDNELNKLRQEIIDLKEKIRKGSIEMHPSNNYLSNTNKKNKVE